MSDVRAELDEATHVATVEIRRGPNNYFDIEVLALLADEMSEVARRRRARAIVLCSEGKHFCAGADFSGAAGRVGRDGAPHLYDVAIRLFEQPLPIVAAVQGAAIGGGLGLALAADFRVATPESRFAANFSRLGLPPGLRPHRHPPARGRAAGRPRPPLHRAPHRRCHGAPDRAVRPPRHGRRAPWPCRRPGR